MSNELRFFKVGKYRKIPNPVGVNEKFLVIYGVTRFKLKFGEYFIHLIGWWIGIGTILAWLYGFSAKTTRSAFFVQKRALRGTRTFELAVFLQ